MRSTALPRGFVIGLVVVVGLGVAGYSTPEKSQNSTSTEVSDDQRRAEKALLSPELKPLSDYKAEKVEYVQKPASPFDECTGEGPDSLKVTGQASREFDGELKLVSHGFALDGDNGGAFGD